MGKTKWLPLIWVSLLTIVLLASLMVLERGRDYIGKQYFISDQFRMELDEFIEKAGPTVLNPLNPKEAKEQITVSQQEIEEHRNQYGSLADQIENIQMQYEDRIASAEGNEPFKSALIEERDAKIEDIRKNFSDDKHVEAKIRKEKEALIDTYMNELKNIREQVSGEYGYFAYSLENVNTGETFKRGELSNAIYKKEYDNNHGLLRVEAVSYSTNAGNEVAGIIGNQVQQFSGTIAIPKAAIDSMDYSHQYYEFKKTKYTIYAFILLGILALATILFKLKFNRNWFTGNKFSDWYNSIRIDWKAVLIFVNAMVAYAILINTMGVFLYNHYSMDWMNRILHFLFSIAFVGILIFQAVNIIGQYKNTEVLKNDLRNSFTFKLTIGIQDLFLNRSIGVQTLFLYAIAFAAGFGLLVVFMMPPAIIIYLPLFLFIALPAILILLNRAGYLNRIMKTAEQMAEGKLHQEIEIRGKSPLAQHAANLNKLREGVQSSISEQAKSERLKTELITNVSHDLRTPLTSIITYTDLLKNPDLTGEEREKYIEILDRKSQRLKTLIEDLFDVSKMASGNIELQKQRVDLTQLLQQALGEHEEEIMKSGLEFRNNIPDVPVVAYVDGQKWWRVLDNLIVNAIKYTLEGTRVYVTLRQNGSEAEFVVKNITKYELGENVDELFERFKRADTSRHTDGSGLGLAIAQSIVDLHGGRMKIDVDGDLFKVTVTIPVV
ncbi:histidine kinase dimerization/phospho-acceptor domain-containing protein [Chungangia koreensis]|uniref:histidine kinase n=1 Tax=Chungangia koreensis TaxID=752657 RepID=A0ABV8X6P8_9LACT